MQGKGILQAKSKNVVAVVDSTKKSPEEILQEAGYKRGKEINDYSAKVKELQKYYTNDELIEAINKQKNSKKSAKYILDRMLEKNNTPKIGSAIANPNENIERKVCVEEGYYDKERLNQKIIPILLSDKNGNSFPTMANPSGSSSMGNMIPESMMDGKKSNMENMDVFAGSLRANPKMLAMLRDTPIKMARVPK